MPFDPTTRELLASMLGAQIGHATAHTLLIDAIKTCLSIQEVQSSLSNRIGNVDSIIEPQKPQDPDLQQVYERAPQTVRASCVLVLSSCHSYLTE